MNSRVMRYMWDGIVMMCREGLGGEGRGYLEGKMFGRKEYAGSEWNERGELTKDLSVDIIHCLSM